MLATTWKYVSPDASSRKHTPAGAMTVTVNVQVAVLPATSRAVHVTGVVPWLKNVPDAGTHVTVTAPGQVSVATGVVNATVEPIVQVAVGESALAVVVTFVGHVIVGTRVSVTVTVNEQVAVLFDASRAVQVTVVTPTLKLDPEAGTHVTVAPGQLSVTVGAGNVTTAAQVTVALAVWLAGQVTTGAWVSLTVTVNVHAAVLADASVAVQVTVVTPRAKVEPEAGTHVAVAPGQLSVTVGAGKVTMAVH